MSKYTDLRCYGCSFSEGTHEDSWPRVLAEKMQLNLFNHAVGGSSTAFSAKNLYNDLLMFDTIKNNSVIVFQVSHPNRIHFSTLHNNFPEGAAMLKHAGIHNNKDNPTALSKYYDDNKDCIDWWITEADTELETIYIQSYVAWLRSISNHFPQHKFIILFHIIQVPAGPIFNKRVIDMIEDTDNFKIIKEFDLSEISRGEVISIDTKLDSYSNAVKYTGNVDMRSNHLTIPNINILVNILEHIIIDKQIDRIEFKKGVFSPVTNVEEYKSLCEAGIVLYKPHIEDRLVKFRK